MAAEGGGGSGGPWNVLTGRPFFSFFLSVSHSRGDYRPGDALHTHRKNVHLVSTGPNVKSGERRPDCHTWDSPFPSGNGPRVRPSTMIDTRPMRKKRFFSPTSLRRNALLLFLMPTGIWAAPTDQTECPTAWSRRRRPLMNERPMTRKWNWQHVYIYTHITKLYCSITNWYLTLLHIKRNQEPI